MNALPDVIYREIFSYIPYVDHISLSMVDKVRCDLLLKRVRIIQINKKAALYFTSQEFRDKIKSLIVDPYHQLSMRLFHPKIPEDFDAFSCSELAGLSAQILSESLIPYLQKVRRLDLYAGSSEHHPSQVIDWINSNPSLSLKELEFSHFSMTDFPLIDQVRYVIFTSSPTLRNIPLHHITPNLHYVLFDACDAIEDVSSLDKIHELHLISCQGIRDISCLNHNSKILIKNCHRITDYSNSFRHTKFIELIIAKEITLDLSKLLKVKELKITLNKRTSFIFPEVISSLRDFYLSDLEFPFIIPAGNRIRRLSIVRCPKFTSLLNCNRIQFVQLSDLNISNLEGLGSGNKIVEITSCPSITDFSVLRTCDKVVIGSCSGLQDLSPLRGIKDLTVNPPHHMPENIEGVTNLTFLGKIADLPSHFPHSVKRLNIMLLSLSDRVSQYPSFLASLPTHINEIKICSVSVKDVEEFREILHDIPQFSFEWHRNIYTSEVYFRRNKN